MTPDSSSLRLRPFASLLVFISAYAPLLIILIVKDLNSATFLPTNPRRCLILLAIAILSSATSLIAIMGIRSGVINKVSKATNKSGEMFAYSIPYMLSFLKVELDDWKTLVSLLIVLSMMFVMAYRTQTVFVNPILALAGYMLFDCTFGKEGGRQYQALAMTKGRLVVGKSYRFEQFSPFLFIATELPNEG